MEDGTSLIKLKAGKSKLDGKLLIADKRKGMLEVLRVSSRFDRQPSLAASRRVHDGYMAHACRTRTVSCISLGASDRRPPTILPDRSQSSTWCCSQGRPHSQSWAGAACLC